MAMHESDMPSSGTFNLDLWNADTWSAEVTPPEPAPSASGDPNHKHTNQNDVSTGENEAHQVASAGSKVKSARKKDERVKIMVTLRGAGSGAEDASANAADRRARYAKMRARAREQQVAVLAWLQKKGVQEEFRRVSDVTAFGTFTMEATAAVAKLIGRAPQVESAIAASDATMELLGAGR